MRFLLLVPCLVLFTACLSKSEVEPRRHFEPLVPALDIATPSRGALNLKSSTSAPHLGEAMAWRLSSVELAFDELHLWAAQPRFLLDQVLREAFFLEGARSPSSATQATSLQVHLEAFEGTLSDQRTANVAVSATLQARDTAPTRILVRRFEASEPLDAKTPEALARGIGNALARVASELSAWVAEPGS